MVERVTFCRICEPCCGLIVTVEDGRIADVRADKENPASKGFMCTKARAMAEIVEDPDRVLYPMKRVGGPGRFERVSWDEAMTDIASRLRGIIDEHGPSAVGTFVGNPVSFNSAAVSATEGFRVAIGAKWKYGVGHEDSASMLVANGLVYGSAGLVPRPDVWHTDFLLVLGANPWVSKGSAISEPRIRDAMAAITARGGRVVVVDPRRTETARHFEHVPIRPGADPWLLLGMLHVMVGEGLIDRAPLEAVASGVDELVECLRDVDLEECGVRSGVPVSTIANLGRAFAQAPTAVAYGRTGTCTQFFGTLTNILINVLNIVTGNLNRRGGWVFGWSAIDIAKMAKQSGYDTFGAVRSRVLDQPDVWGVLPSQSLPYDILTPGEGQVRALLTVAGNPVISSGGGGRWMEDALSRLDLHVSLDLYMNESNRNADYILPAPTFYERDDIPFLAMGFMVRPTLQVTDPVIEKRGETREEWRVFNDLARRLGRGGAYPVAPLRWLSRWGIEISPNQLFDVMIRTGPVGDWFGLRRSGLSIAKLKRRHPHGVELRPDLPIPPLRDIVETPDGRARCAPPELFAEIDRLRAHVDDPEYPMRVIGMREIRSHNTWMHNSRRLVPSSRTPAMLVHPADAAQAGIDGDGGSARIISAHGDIVMRVVRTPDVAPGVVAVPHGWGHEGGWMRANAAGGANSNALTSKDPADFEPVAGMSVLNGIPVRIEAVPAADAAAVPAADLRTTG